MSAGKPRPVGAPEQHQFNGYCIRIRDDHVVARANSDGWEWRIHAAPAQRQALRVGGGGTWDVEIQEFADATFRHTLRQFTAHAS